MAFEYAHFHWELSWPWLNLGNIFARVPALVQWYSYSGILGGTLWILISNILIFRIIRNVRLNKESLKIQTPLFIGLGAVLFVPVIISGFMYINYEESGEIKTVMAMQPNMDAYTEKFKYSNESHATIISEDISSHGGETCDLIIAPETTLLLCHFLEEDIKKYDFYGTFTEASR